MSGGSVAAVLDALDPGLVLDTIVGLCRIPSVSGEERAISAWTAAWLRGRGFDTAEQEVLPGRTNVIATLATGRPGPRLLFNGHLDNLPVPAGITRDPFDAAVVGDRLYGGEVNNMKGAVGGMMAAMVALRAHRDLLCGEVVLSAVIGECEALGLGTSHALEHGLTADCCINGEPTDLAVMTAHSGVTQLTVTVTGRSAHVSQREAGVNAIEKLVALLPGFTEGCLTFTPHADFPGLPTLNVGVIRGGSLPSMLAAEAEAGIDVRTVPGMTPDSVLADLRRVVEAAAARDPSLKAELRLRQRPAFVQQYPFHVAREAPIVQAVAGAHRRLTGAAPRVGTLFPQVFYGTDASHLSHAGIPTAIYGPGKVTEINVPDESCAVADLLQAARVYALGALAVCGRDAAVRAEAVA
jgi:acetylornithine deacetylase